MTRRAIVVGAGGALGAAMLEHALGAGLFTQVVVLADEPIAPALRGFVAVDRARLEAGGVRADTAFVVFDRVRGMRGREDAFHRPDPLALPTLAQMLHNRCGVVRLLLVLPHAPALLPQALKVGLASLDEQAVAAAGFEQLVILRPSQAAAGEAQRSLPQRVAQGMLAQLRWMIPQREQPVRPGKIAALAVEIARALPRTSAGTRVAPPELVWQAAQPQQDVGALVQGWLEGALADNRAH
jgi:hypothetical protein